MRTISGAAAIPQCVSKLAQRLPPDACQKWRRGYPPMRVKSGAAAANGQDCKQDPDAGALEPIAHTFPIMRFTLSKPETHADTQLSMNVLSVCVSYDRGAPRDVC